MGEHELNRKLGSLERLFWILEHDCRVHFVMHARVRGELNEDVLRPALEAVQKRHPMLRVHIERSGWISYRFKPIGDAPIPLRCVDRPSDEWAMEAENELNQVFPSDHTPLVRCVLVRHGPEDGTILLTFHHAIGDAMSGAYLLRDLIQAAARLKKGEAPSLPHLPVRDELTAYFPSWAKGWSGRWRYTKLCLRVAGAMLFHGLPFKPAFDRVAPPGEQKAVIIPLELAPGLIDDLHQRASQEGTTIHGAMLAAQILSLYQDIGGPQKRLFVMGSPINLRKRLNPPLEQDVGLFVTIGVSISRVGPDEDFWTLARQVRQSLWDGVERGEPFCWLYQQQDRLIIMSLFGANRVGIGIHNRLARLANLGGLSFSNIGVVDIETVQDPFFIRSLGFAASGASISPHVAFAATVENRSTWNFMGMEPLLSREHIRRIAHGALDILKSSVEETRG